MKVKLCIIFKIIVIHILTINKEYKKLHFIRYLKVKKMTHYFLNHPDMNMLELDHGIIVAGSELVNASTCLY